MWNWQKLGAEEQDNITVEMMSEGALSTSQGMFNDRPEKALLRMFREGPSGFAGGLNASKYMAITGATSATATRDLGVLVKKGALAATGELNGRRYHLNVPMRPTPHVTLDLLQKCGFRASRG